MQEVGKRREVADQGGKRAVPYKREYSVQIGESKRRGQCMQGRYRDRRKS